MFIELLCLEPLSSVETCNTIAKDNDYILLITFLSGSSNQDDVSHCTLNARKTISCYPSTLLLEGMWPGKSVEHKSRKLVQDWLLYSSTLLSLFEDG